MKIKEGYVYKARYVEEQDVVVVSFKDKLVEYRGVINTDIVHTIDLWWFNRFYYRPAYHELLRERLNEE